MKNKNIIKLPNIAHENDEFKSSLKNIQKTDASLIGLLPSTAHLELLKPEVRKLYKSHRIKIKNEEIYEKISMNEVDLYTIHKISA